MKSAKNPLIFVSIIFIVLAGCQHKNDSPAASSNGIVIKKAWARPAAEGLTSAAYFSIYNETTKQDTLLEIESESSGSAKIHESYTTEDGLSGMRPAKKLVIAPGDSLILKPGGLHVMLMNLTQGLSATDSLKLQLHFAQSGKYKLSVPIQQ